MKTIKFLVLHPVFCHDKDSALKYLKIESLQEDFEFVWEATHPDYLIATEHIFKNGRAWKLFLDLSKKAKITIFHGGESISPDFNIFDYAVGYDCELVNGDRFAHLPSQMTFFSEFLNDSINKISLKTEAQELLRTKKKFCNFLYSNPNSHPMRDQLFFEISKYKKVDSLGRHLNNVEKAGTGFVGYEQDCISLKNPYKFSIASENATFAGYTSEKVFTSFCAHTVPIYWGDPNVDLNVNPKAIIWMKNGMSFEELIDKIKEVDENDDLWCQMISEPWQTVEQIGRAKKRNEDYVSFWEHIFGQSVIEAVRKPCGTYPNLYKKFFFSAKPVERNIVMRTAISMYKTLNKNYKR